MKARIIEKIVDVPNSLTGRRFIVRIYSAYRHSTQPEPLSILCESKDAAKQLKEALDNPSVLWVC